MRRQRRDHLGSHRRPARERASRPRPPRAIAKKTPSPRAQAGNVVRRIAAENARLRRLTPLERAALHPTQRLLAANTITQYRRTLTNLARNVPLADLTPKQAFDWLQKRGRQVQQNTLNCERIAIQRMMWLDGRLPQGEPIRGPRKPGGEPRIPEGRVQKLSARALPDRQIDAVIAELQRRQDTAANRTGHAATDHAFVAKLALATGIRAHEAITLARPGEQPPHDRAMIQQRNHDRIVDRLNRRSPPDRGLPPVARRADVRQLRFLGRAGVRYTVIGKGGLVRDVLVPRNIHLELESRRLARPLERVDRGITYTQRYSFGTAPGANSSALGGGQAFSAAWTRASKAVLGWSTGVHALRHSYVQNRMAELRSHVPQAVAKHIASIEVGHHRETVTDTYLR